MSEKHAICVPGDRLASVEQNEAGYGTYVKHGYIFASLAGTLQKTFGPALPKISVESKHFNQKLPGVGSIVTCKIIGISTRFAKCSIIAVNNVTISEPFRGMIRREDVRAKDIDRVEIVKSFRPGDVVLAKVLSLGDASFYLLTTAEDELGVGMAHSEAGIKMVPISWQEMQCPETYVKEFRKVARPQREHLAMPDR